MEKKRISKPQRTEQNPPSPLYQKGTKAKQIRQPAHKPNHQPSRRQPLAWFAFLLICIAFGAVYAATKLVPNTSEFPQYPNSPGSLGYAFDQAFYPDGTAKNAQKLAGVSASGYLQNNECQGFGVWKGIDASGKAICDQKGGMLACFARFSDIVPSGSIQVVKPSGTVTATTTTELCTGDQIRTGGGTGTIRFAADNSIIRLDRNTTLDLQEGQLDGKSVAEAILSDGRLWGRILTSTGVNLGGGGMVAGVRGTGIDVVKNTTSKTAQVAVAQSQLPTPVKINCSPGGGSPVPSGVGIGERKTYDDTCKQTTLATTLKALYSTDRWIPENVITDIMYLNSLIQSGALAPENRTIAEKELAVTLPQSQEQKDTLCGIDRVYWDSLKNSATQPVCQDKRILAMVDFTDVAKGGKMNYKNSNNSTSPNNAEVQYTFNGNPVTKIYDYNTLLGMLGSYPEGSHQFSGGELDLDIAISRLNQQQWMENDDCHINKQEHRQLRLALEEKKSNGYTKIRFAAGNVTNNDDPRGSITLSCLGGKASIDSSEFQGGIYFMKPAQQQLALTPSGVSITGNQYISYDLAELQKNLPGGTLAGKTIEIEFGDINQMKAYGGVLFRGYESDKSMSFNKNDGEYYCMFSGSFTSKCIYGQDYEEIGNIVKIYLPIGFGTIKSLFFGNSNPTFASNPLGGKIKNIRILN